jgi:hypothetical protein
LRHDALQGLSQAGTEQFLGYHRDMVLLWAAVTGTQYRALADSAFTIRNCGRHLIMRAARYHH